jgi:hypothetical protein
MAFDVQFFYDFKDRIIRIENKNPKFSNKIEIGYFNDVNIRKINVYDGNSKITKTVIFKYEDLK